MLGAVLLSCSTVAECSKPAVRNCSGEWRRPLPISGQRKTASPGQSRNTTLPQVRCADLARTSQWNRAGLRFRRRTQHSDLDRRGQQAAFQTSGALQSCRTGRPILQTGQSPHPTWLRTIPHSPSSCRWQVKRIRLITCSTLHHGPISPNWRLVRKAKYCCKGFVPSKPTFEPWAFLRERRAKPSQMVAGSAACAFMAVLGG